MESSYFSFSSKNTKSSSPSKFSVENSYGSLITDGTYEVALSNIKYPNQWKTFNDSKCFIREMFNVHQKTDLEVKIPGAHIEHTEALVSYVNKIIRRKFNEFEAVDNSCCPIITYDSGSNTFTQETGYGEKSNLYVLEFKGDLNYIFGFDDYGLVYDLQLFDLYITWSQQVTYNGYKTLWGKVPPEDKTPEKVPEIKDVVNKMKIKKAKELEEMYPGFEQFYLLFQNERNIKFDKSFKKVFKTKSTNNMKIEPLNGQMFVCCNIVNSPMDYSPIKKLLRVVDVTNNDFSQVHNRQSFADLIYVPVSTSLESDIEITICDEDGNEFPFTGGNSRVALHIRRKQHAGSSV